MNQTFQDLRRLIDRSRGAPITLPSGLRRSFRQKKKFSTSDVDDFESLAGVDFPDEYRELLTTVGMVDCFIDETGTSAVELYDPASVTELYSDFFANPDELRRYLPVACDNRLQEIVVVLLDRPAPQNVFVVSHEMHPDDWPEVISEVGATSLEAWLAEAISTDGQLEPH
jgi:hypothetical protein